MKNQQLPKKKITKKSQIKKLSILFISLFFLFSYGSISLLKHYEELSKKDDKVKKEKLLNTTKEFKELFKSVKKEQKNIAEVLFLGLNSVAGFEEKIQNVNKKNIKKISENLFSTLNNRFMT